MGIWLATLATSVVSLMAMHFIMMDDPALNSDGVVTAIKKKGEKGSQSFS